MSLELEEARKYAPVLRRMIELLGAAGAEQMTFGEALNRAATELEIKIPWRAEEALLITACKIIAGGRLPGAPDA